MVEFDDLLGKNNGIHGEIAIQQTINKDLCTIYIYIYVYIAMLVDPSIFGAPQSF